MSSPVPGTSKTSSPASPSPGVGTSRGRVTRARKRKRIPSESSSDTEAVLPENLLEVEKNLHASAIKNNLDDDSVKKIIKTVVTNDHVLALVKLQEEEQNAMQPDNPKPKLTRAKVKELKKVSPKTTWNLGLDTVELTPIKRIPVKTRPEVSALIDQELPEEEEDEDDEEYEPTHDDVPSDDDHTLESCSDVDSQPRTPATPRRDASPRVVKDGPFKVPQEVTPRRKLEMDEDATIALRTRSKLSLSSIPIDHIESSFVPPDDLPVATDDVWTDFLQICLNPDTEDADDDDDPEYDVAKDPDAHDEDEEGLENIIKISKKELNDLVTELFNVMPENLDTVLSGKLGSEPATQNNAPIQSSSWEGKQEPASDDETPATSAAEARKKRLSIGKSEPISDSECRGESKKENRQDKEVAQPTVPTQVTMSVLEGEMDAYPAASAPAPPAPLQSLLQAKQTLTVQIQPGAKVLPEQIQILQQQLRQHIQLATSNFLQLFAHPVHWSLAPNYKEYLETLYKMVQDNPKSVADVCNLKPAVELVRSWEKSVSEDTPENKKIIEFVQGEIERGRRRAAQNCLYVGDFHHMFLNVISNSPVFLYPYLLPPLPYRSDGVRKFNYVRSEDELIAIGIEQFWHYVENNPELFKIRATNANARAGLITTVQLVIKHMFPWMTPKAMMNHIKHVKKHFKSNEENPINKFFATGEVTPVKHTLLPYNPNLTLYEQPENEMPKIWIKYLAKSSQRFQDHLFRRTTYLNRVGVQPAGVPIDLGTAVKPPTKKPLPIAFTQELSQTKPTETLDEETPPITAQNVIYSVIQTPSGAFLLPVTLVTNTDSATTPICSSEVNETISSNLPEESTVSKVSVTVPIKNCAQVENGDLIVRGNSEHCACCIVLRNISKRQSLITDFFKEPIQKSCPCKLKRKVKYPSSTRKLRLLVNNYKSKATVSWQALNSQIKLLMNEMRYGSKKPMTTTPYSLEEITAVISFQLKLTIRSNIARNIYIKRRIHSLMAKFNPDVEDIYPFTAQVEKILGTEAVDVYNEFLSFLTMEQADKIGRYKEYFKQECLIGLMKKVEELVPNKQHKHNILTCAHNLLSDTKLSACDICTKLLNACSRYPALCDYVFSLFPHTRFPKCIEKEKIPFGAPASNKKAIKKQSSAPKTKVKKVNADSRPTENLEQNKSDPQAKDNKEHSKDVEAITKIDKLSKDTIAPGNIEERSKVAEGINNTEEHSKGAEIIDNIEDPEIPNNPEVTNNIDISNSQATENVEDEADPLSRDNPDEEMCNDSQTMDYEADHSDSDDDGVENLTIIEDPEEAIQAQRRNVKNEHHMSENVIDTPNLTITKTEIQDPSESDMSMMIMSEDENSIVKTEPAEWKRDEDKRLLEVLQQSLTPDEIKDKTILEIIEQKKVLKLAAENLPEKSLDDVRERILYLLEFLVASQ